MREFPNLKAELQNGKRILAVYGIGFVGTAIATVWLRAGAKVVAVDEDPSIVEKISRGVSPTGEPMSRQAFSRGLRENRLISTSDGEWASRSSQILIVSVPVGFSHGRPDFGPLDLVTSVIASGLKRRDVVIVTPTVPVGTSDRVISELELKSGLKVERDFYYVYSPERISYGGAVADIEENYPAVVSGAGPRSLSIGNIIYSIISAKGTIKMSSTRAAEMEKLLEGVYRDVNIALANEFQLVCKEVGIDFWEVRRAANSQPHSRIHKAGVGVGGFCIPIYPQMLIRMGTEHGVQTRLTRLARSINLGMPKATAIQVVSLLRRKKSKIIGSKVAILGLAFRGDVPDRRLSPTYDLVKELARYKMDIAVHDPFFETDLSLGKGVRFSNDISEIVKAADVVIIATDHTEYKKLNGKRIRRLSTKEPIVFDGRGILSPRNFSGMDFARIGSP